MEILGKLSFQSLEKCKKVIFAFCWQLLGGIGVIVSLVLINQNVLVNWFSRTIICHLNHNILLNFLHFEEPQTTLSLSYIDFFQVRQPSASHLREKALYQICFPQWSTILKSWGNTVILSAPIFLIRASIMTKVFPLAASFVEDTL